MVLLMQGQTTQNAQACQQMICGKLFGYLRFQTRSIILSVVHPLLEDIRAQNYMWHWQFIRIIRKDMYVQNILPSLMQK